MHELDAALNATTTNVSSPRKHGLTMATLQAAVEALGPPPEEPKHYIRIGDKTYPIKDFSLQLDPKSTFIGMDMAKSPDHSVLTVWQREELKASLTLKPGWCGWGVWPDGDTTMGTGKFIPYTIHELRQLRKRMRTKKDKETLKSIARNPALCQQDRRKLKRLARRKAAQIQRLTGEKTTFKVYNRGRYGTGDLC